MGLFSFRKKTKVDFILTIFSRFATIGSAAGSAIIIAHTMGKEGLGIFGLLRAVPGVLLLLTELGISSASPYLINYRKIAPQRVLSNALFAGILVGVIDFILWQLGFGLLSKHIFNGLASHWIVLAGLLPLLMALKLEILNILRGTHRFRSANIVLISSEAFILIFLSIMAYIEIYGLHVLVIGILIAHVITILIGLLLFLIDNYRPIPVLDKKLLCESIRFGIRAQIGNTASMLNFRLDHLILGFMTNPGTVGVYVVATKAAEVFGFIPWVLRYLLEPKISKRSHKEANRIVKLLYPIIFSINFAIIGVAFFLGPIFLPLLFDSWSLTAVWPFRILLIGMIARGGNGLFAALNMGHGRPQFITYAEVAALIMTVTMCILLVPNYGVLGASVASSVAYTTGAVTLVILFYMATSDYSYSSKGDFKN